MPDIYTIICLFRYHTEIMQGLICLEISKSHLVPYLDTHHFAYVAFFGKFLLLSLYELTEMMHQNKFPWYQH